MAGVRLWSSAIRLLSKPKTFHVFLNQGLLFFRVAIWYSPIVLSRRELFCDLSSSILRVSASPPRESIRTAQISLLLSFETICFAVGGFTVQNFPAVVPRTAP